MERFEWSEDIALRLPAIDAQHRQLIGWFNTLDDAVLHGEGAQVIGSTLENLINYVYEHFSAEEELMLTAGYPGFDRHREEHDSFVSRLRELQAGFLDSEEMCRQTLAFLAGWIVSHIRVTDTELGRFLADSSVPE